MANPIGSKSTDKSGGSVLTWSKETMSKEVSSERQAQHRNEHQRVSHRGGQKEEKF